VHYQTAVVVVEDSGRLARFGVEHLHAVLAPSGRRLVVLDLEESTSELAGDVTEVLTWCARRCGQRAAKNRAARVIAVATGGSAE
jgi:putative resolvase